MAVKPPSCSCTASKAAVSNPAELPNRRTRAGGRMLLMGSKVTDSKKKCGQMGLEIALDLLEKSIKFASLMGTYGSQNNRYDTKTPFFMNRFTLTLLLLVAKVPAGWCQIQITHSPYLQALHDTGVTIVWTTDK